MIIAVGCDHAGFPLKAHVIDIIRLLKHEVLDCGATKLLPEDDYPDYALAVAEAVRSGKANRGIVVCGSGVGVSVAANKVPGIRSAMCHDTFSARQGVEDDSMNVLCLGARVIGPELAADVVRAYLPAQFSGLERHQRRLNKVLQIEADALAGKLRGPRVDRPLMKTHAANGCGCTVCGWRSSHYSTCDVIGTIHWAGESVQAQGLQPLGLIHHLTDNQTRSHPDTQS